MGTRGSGGETGMIFGALNGEVLRPSRTIDSLSCPVVCSIVGLAHTSRILYMRLDDHPLSIDSLLFTLATTTRTTATARETNEAFRQGPRGNSKTHNNLPLPRSHATQNCFGMMYTRD